jgi:hypothetical protein
MEFFTILMTALEMEHAAFMDTGLNTSNLKVYIRLV